MKPGILRCLVGLCVALSQGQARAAEIQVAVAANFAGPIKAIAQGFERDSGHQVTLSLGSTGQLAAQIKNGAPFDVFLAADQDTPRKLELDGKAVSGSRFTYATGHLVLWSKQPGIVDAQGDVLKTAHFDRLAIASPKLAPYGAAAMTTLERLGLKDTLAPKIVEGAHIAQAYQWVATGHALLGFVALSQVYAQGQLVEGSAWRVPGHLHAPLHQDAVILTRTKHLAASQAFLTYLRSERARAVMRSFGYGVGVEP